jgi:hypothetical protein
LHAPAFLRGDAAAEVGDFDRSAFFKFGERIRQTVTRGEFDRIAEFGCGVKGGREGEGRDAGCAGKGSE